MERDIRDNIWDTDQLIVRVGKACNFRCNFCNVTDNERNVKLRENIDDIVRNFHYKLKYSNTESWEIIVTISGWEPSIFQKETIFALRYIQSFLTKRWVTPIFEIQTNASNIDKNFARQLKENGIYLALVSFHMEDKGIFEEVIGIKYSNFYKIIEGIHNLHEAGIKVDTNSILSSQNISNYFDTIKFLSENFPFIDTFNIWVIQPHWEALKILDEVIPLYEEVAPIYNKVIFYLRRQKKRVTSHYVGLPACYIENYGTSLEVTDNTLFRKNLNVDEKHLINNINDSNKKQDLVCSHCMYKNVCSGVWKEYIGIQKLNPSYYVRDFHGDFTNSQTSYKVWTLDTNIEAVYDSWVRHVLIESNIWSSTEVFELTRKCMKLWLYQISVIAKNQEILSEDVFYSWVTNIQLNINLLNIEFLQKLVHFSKNKWLQFRIDIDIFIYEYNEENIEKLQHVIPYLSSSFVKVFFIKKSYNSNIHEYTKLLDTLKYNKNTVYTVGFYPELLFRFDNTYV